MTLTRRHFVALAGPAFAAPMPFGARALDYPNRAVRWVVGFAPGGPQDIVARLVAQGLSERLGQPFVVENRAGAGGNIGAEAVVNAPPDGYTMLLVGSPNTINATLYRKLNFVLGRDIAPVAAIGRTSLLLEVNPSLPVRTIGEFIAYAKANPGKINYASAGVGTPQHVSGELFNMMAGIAMVHVPYRGASPALADLLAGQVQAMIDPLPASIPYAKSGRLRPLAVTSLARLPELPDLPTVAEYIPGYQTASWYAVGVPRNTPAEIIAILNQAINAAIADPKLKARLAELGVAPMGGTAADLARHIAEETEKWAQVIRLSGARAD
jgi:tripartite-type tricarboxylate transporter receptor subunit TctC